MAFQPVKSERSPYHNEVRAQWAARLTGVRGMAECTALLREFRTSHVGPQRETYRLNHDALWIENAIEQRLAQLKAVEQSDDELQTRCTTGELAAQVCEAWQRRVEKASASQLEALALEVRRTHKPPIMPVNAWAPAQRTLVTALMLARAERRPWELTTEELRAERGARLVAGRDLPTHKVTVRFEDQESLVFECGEHEDVISAALREQIILLSQCREGQCATCKGVCGAGDFQFGKGVNVYSLPQEEQDDGLVLLCQTFPRSDLLIDLPYSREMVTLGVTAGRGDLLARVHTFEKCTPTTHRLVLEHVNPITRRPRALSYTPGQYVNIMIPGTDQWRSFSMASPSRDDGLLEFLVKEIPGGMFSARFWGTVHAGLELSIQGPFGMFHVNRQSQRPRVFLAGGTGIAPLLAMLRHLAQAGDRTPSHLLFAVSEADAALCQLQLQELQTALPELKVDRSVSTGRSNDVLTRFEAALVSGPQAPEVYLSGPEGLVAAGEAVCRTQRISVRQIYTEKFLPSGTGVLRARPSAPSAGADEDQPP